MKSETDMGLNRTGIGTSPVHAREMAEMALKSTPTSMGSGQDLLTIREDYARQAGPIGTVPPPGTLKGMIKAVGKTLTGKRVTVFLDKLGERLAYERTGTRLYEGLIGKLDLHGSWSGGPTREELRHFHHEELAHFERLRRALEELGADPTAVTPSANVALVAGSGVVAVIEDARTDLHQCLQALLTAELTDNDHWRMLVKLARAMGQDKMVADFEQALREEDRHLSSVRDWMESSMAETARVEVEGVPAGP